MAPKRALILAGGGVKVAFQAGVLQVWLDEAGLTFDHADGASGGVFNLAMYCQQMSGTEIADAWRRTVPVEGVTVNAAQLPRLAWARSLFTLDGYRKNVFPVWGLDWKKINASPRSASFNMYNFSKHELEVKTAAEMNEDWLCAGVSLPMWFEPVVIDGDTYIDPVYVTDANLEEAIARGADELWIVWTVSTRGEWNDGFIANYFQIIEAASYGNYKRILQRIERSNAAIAKGLAGEFGRPIALKILQAEVPIHYLANFSKDRLEECVNLGVQAARAWCKEQKLPLREGKPAPTQVDTAATRLEFSEVMKGHVGLGVSDYAAGSSADASHSAALAVDLTIKVAGINRFVTRPEHEAEAVGTITCKAFGGTRPVTKGSFNLLVHEGDPRHRFFHYRLWFEDDKNRALTLVGYKEVKNDPGIDVWADTTTLYTRILEGHSEPGDDAGRKLVAAGILKLHFLDFLKELTTFRTEGPTLADRSAALARFGELFLGKLWEVYATQILATSPF
jgi:predicted acylesterase/phospholipase RssA